VQIGYWLGVPFWGRGIASEVVRRLVACAWERWPHIHTLWGRVHTTNPASARVLSKVGFTVGVTARRALIKRGAVVDLAVLQLHRSDGGAAAPVLPAHVAALAAGPDACRSAAVPRPVEAPLAPIAWPAVGLQRVDGTVAGGVLEGALAACGVGQRFPAERWGSWRAGRDGGGGARGVAVIADLLATPPPAGRALWLVQAGDDDGSGAVEEAAGVVEAVPGAPSRLRVNAGGRGVGWGGGGDACVPLLVRRLPPAVAPVCAAGPLQDRGTVRVAVAIAPRHRGRKVGVAALRCATAAVWATFPEANRLEVVVPIG
jgi:hypothetical protein